MPLSAVMLMRMLVWCHAAIQQQHSSTSPAADGAMQPWKAHLSTTHLALPSQIVLHHNAALQQRLAAMAQELPGRDS